MYLFCLVQQAQEDLHAKYKEMEKELKLYKEKEAALAAPPVLSAPPKVVPSAPPQVVAPPKVVSPAPSIPPAGLLQKNSLASSALPGESLGKAKKFVEETFVNVTGKDQQSIRRRLISRSFRDQSYAIEGGSVVKYALTSTGEFGNEIVDQMAKYWDGKEAKKTCDIDQLVRDQRKRENVVVDGRLQQLVDATEDGNSLELPAVRAGSWPLEGLLVNRVFQTIVGAARDGFQVKSGLNTDVVSRSWIANGIVRFEEIKVYAFLFV